MWRELTEPDPELDHMRPLTAYLLVLVMIIGVAVASLLQGQQARERCAAGIDTEASCQGVLR